MATREQADELMRLFGEARPQEVSSWQRRGRTSGTEGMLGVLLCLYRSKGALTSGEISRLMRVTTGRVSVLTKKMEEKGLVTRSPGANDARVTEVRLTGKGRGIVDDLDRQRTAQLEELIDTVGMDRLREYLEVQRQVFAILTPPEIDL